MGNIHGRYHRIRRTAAWFGVLFALVCGALLRVPVGSAGATGDCTTAANSTTCTFSYTGGIQTWTVPAGITEVTLDVYGAQGGDNPGNANLGGRGGRTTATISVTPGETLTIVVGGRGHEPGGGGALGGFNGGGNGGAPYLELLNYSGAGGGGASDVRIGGSDLDARIIVAGGGGGAANLSNNTSSSFGGAGGGESGGTGGSLNTDCTTWFLSCPPPGGAGGNQNGSAGSGQRGQGSNGANNTTGAFNRIGGGGGGGGYYGGAGGPAATGGGGGSGFGPAGTVFATGVRAGDGLVLVTYTPPQAATITLDSATLNPAYDGSPHAATATTDPAGLGYSVTYNGSGTPPTDAGSYAVVATITTPGYSSSPATGTLTIARAASCVVTTTADSGPGSLRALLPNCAAITFDLAAMGTGTIILQSDLPTITAPTTVTGPGAASLTIQRTAFPIVPTGTAFPVGAGGDLTLSGVTVSRASIGVDVAAGGAVTVTGSTLSGNATNLQLNGATATVTNSTISSCATGLSVSAGSSATVTGSTFFGCALGLRISGGSSATVTGSTISSSGGAAGLQLDSGSATVTGSTFSNNTTGLLVGQGGSATVDRSTFSGNTTYAIRVFNGIGTVTNSTLTGNTTGLLVAAGGTATMTGSTISGGGTGLVAGGGVTTLTVANSTIAAGNIGVQNNNLGAVTLINSTVKTTGAGGTNVDNPVPNPSNPYTKTALVNTLLAKPDGGKNCTSAFITSDSKNNLADDNTCFADGTGPGNASHVVATAQLGLATASPVDNGGPTYTIALLPGSLAIGKGDDNTCTNAPVSGKDQRGQPRKAGACDIGAYEVQALPTALASVSGGGTYGGGVALTATLRTPDANGTPVAGQTVAFALGGTFGGTALCGDTTAVPCPLTDSNGVATLTVPLGLGAATTPNGVCATFATSAAYLGSGPACGTLTIGPATLTVTPSPQNPSRAYGAANPTIGPGYSGFVGTEGPGVLATAPTCSTTAGSTADVGTYPITCSGGVAANYAFNYVAGTLTVTPAPQSITFTSTAPAGATYGGTYTVTATGGGSGKPVTFSSQTTGVCTVAGGTVSFVGVGPCIVAADQAGTTNYSAAPTTTQSFTVGQAGSTTTVTASNANFTGSPYSGASATATGAGGLNQTLAITYSGRNTTNYGPSSNAPTLVGDYTASATFPGDTNHTGSNGSANFSITNLPPAVTIAAPTLGSVVAAPYTASFSATFADPGDPTPHTCTIVWDDGTTTTLAASGTSAGTCATTHPFTTAGVYTIQVTIADGAGLTGSATVMLVVYDPTAGFVTGGGWINSAAGAYRANPALAGKASFGFVSKYQKGASAPTGETEFAFEMAGFSFRSSTYQWLVVSGAKAQYKGTGTVNGVGGYSFLLTATDGQLTGGGGVDKFRIKIWNTATGAIVYDNRFGSSDDLDTADPQAIGGGSIVIHK